MAAASPRPAPPAAAMPEDDAPMARALQLAARGINTTHPNPRVGCVIVKDGAVVGEGWHRAAGEDHAEIAALHQAGRAARTATMYVTLEPCTHHGRTPPCVDAVCAAGLGRVVIAMSDPNPRVNGAGIAALRAAGIAVSVGAGHSAALALNRGFARRMQCGVPWVTLKLAASIDGRTALANGDSQWITEPAARRDAHHLRAACSAILTGSGTVVADDPRLTARLPDLERQPLRVILDRRLRTPAHAKVLQPPGRALILTAAAHPAPRGAAEIVTCPAADGRMDLHHAMRLLGEREVNELLVEAGPRLSGAMLAADRVDEVILYLAPDILGDTAHAMFDLPPLSRLADKHRFRFHDIRQVGRDLRLTLRRAPPAGDSE